MSQSLRIFLALMLLILLVVLWRLFGGYRVVRVRSPRSDDVPESLERTNFSAPTRGVTDDRYLRHQLRAHQGHDPTPGEMQIARDGLTDLRRAGRRTEMHLRHVVPDSLIRRLTVQFIRAPTEYGYITLRRFYEAMGATGLLMLWDGIWPQLRGTDPARWYTTLGAARVGVLQELLTNLQDNLFLSESQGNLHAGTLIDLTEEGVVQLGEARIRQIVDATVHALEVFGLMPSIRLVGREYMLGYEGAGGELWRFGYRATRAHDQQLDPLRYMGYGSAEAVLRNTPPRALLGYFRANLGARRLLYGCILLVASYYLNGVAISALGGPNQD